MLTDSFGRTINYLRISVTDRCDFRCVYCMAEDMQFLPRTHILTLEEINQIAEAFAELGVRKIRITGGEPLIRRNIDQLFHHLSVIEALDELTLTTNGSQLTRYADHLAKSGVKRINISLDSLQPQRFKALTRTGDLSKVLDGIDAALHAGIKVKLNSVILKNRNADETLKLVEFATARSMDISFIEEMPLGDISEHQRGPEFVSSAELREMIQRRYKLVKIEQSNSSTAGPSRYWSITGSTSKLGFISPHSENFCASCNRVRLTATGKLLLCLGNEHSVDLKAVVRQNPNDSEKLKEAIINSLSIKPEKHHFQLSEPVEILRFMNLTGG